jgi:hypothetical protein
MGVNTNDRTVIRRLEKAVTVNINRALAAAMAEKPARQTKTREQSMDLEGCIGLKSQGGTASSWCGKIRAPESVYCPHHKLLYDDLQKDPQRRKERAQQRRDERKAEEEYLSTSPLRGDNPQFVEGSGRSRRPVPSPSIDERSISQSGDKFQVDSDPLAEMLAEVVNN